MGFDIIELNLVDLLIWLAVALDQGVAEEIQPLCRQAKRPRVQAT